MKRHIPIGLLMLASLLGGCSDNAAYETAMCVLADVSGTYADEKHNIAKITKAGVVSQLLPGDSLFFIRIDSNSYNEGDLIAKLTLDYIPSKANQQRLAFAEKLDEFAKSKTRARYTDISGAMLLCKDFLKDVNSGNKAILLFSDMKEELKPGTTREFAKDEFDGIDIAAMNVIKLNADSADPKVYRDRLDHWEKKVTAAGAKSWSVILDAINVPDYVEQLR